ncbi:uncharacterized protein BX663DRAFT_489370 [Cokeromyces recurvatus]|uniref:uncharacterized protein n=1 Tax=Cokeromyces recurvatus TaxID=90255 RepID=UPI00221E814C|nr:uncharacterized protein BX663DRAFT_489370 [Cokeromyces recurvatus]KAI7899256.1 hypothetical protein BX663DRAFT_489370 [Cokeromyces recurvatus]
MNKLTAPYVHLNSHDNITAMIDYTNLYIKNLDLEITSYDLFKKFRIYGKIISARVMKDTVTSISKGYGFVSFTTMEEASEALQYMNGALLNTKNIIVTYHTHKKKIAKLSSSSNHHLLENPFSTTTTTTTTSSTSSPLPPSYHTPPPPPIQATNSLLDSTYCLIPSTSIQIQKLREAICQHLSKEEQERDLNDLVDLIQSLKKRELSLCLFNPHFLKQKIEEAYDALYLFKTNTRNRVEHNAAVAILKSLEGLSLNKQKRLFGDLFFPYVRATGIKYAPKVTIQLLDTIPLEELAFIMYDKPELMKKVQYAYSQLYNNNN